MATILYVEDEDGVRRALRGLLVRRGHTVIEASSLATAQTALLERDVDLVLIDLWLGAESGLDLFEWIDMQRPALARRTVFVTGDAVREPEVERTLEILERPVLVKPFPLSELERAIAECLAH